MLRLPSSQLVLALAPGLPPRVHHWQLLIMLELVVRSCRCLRTAVQLCTLPWCLSLVRLPLEALRGAITSVLRKRLAPKYLCCLGDEGLLMEFTASAHAGGMECSTVFREGVQYKLVRAVGECRAHHNACLAGADAPPPRPHILVSACKTDAYSGWSRVRGKGSGCALQGRSS